MKTKAILIGASGRVGRALARELSTLYETVILITRSQPRVMSANMHVYHVTDFQTLEMTIDKISIGADTDAFSCLGVTKSQVASMDEFYQVNALYNMQFASACHKKGVKRFFYLSKAGADKPKNNAELLAKADVEYHLQQLKFEELLIFRLAKLSRPTQKLSLLRINQLFADAKQKLIDTLSFDDYEVLTPKQVAACMALVAYQTHQSSHRINQQAFSVISHEKMCQLLRIKTS